MPLQSVRPDILRGWKTELLDWDGDPSTADALLLAFEQIAAGHGVSLEHYRQAYDPDADRHAPRQVAETPDLTELRERIRQAQRQNEERE